MNKALEELFEEVPLFLETCSVGESFSTTTTTVPETREDEVTRNRIRGREQRQPKSTAKGPEIPPEKKVVVGSRSVRRRNVPAIRTAVVSHNC
ncbi:hypothetical protein A2U01_0036960 [Trifolium medium]|uniref:Uncharacterized protein n=1 Tax=Trifolium medium TaxID=97028 RepID=A0A392PUP7_9FABA|nr:hypothetical protein [Trifolium medium]